MIIATAIERELADLKEKQLFRELRVAEHAPDRIISIAGKNYINFSSNNYLGLANHPAVKKAAVDAVLKYGAGASASRLISGTLTIHRKLEKELADFKHAEDALVFPTGFQTSLGVITSLVSKDDAVIVDRLCHASLIDAARLSGAKMMVYAHGEPLSLENILKRNGRYRRRLVVTDGVFSMDGDIAPLRELSDICRGYDSTLFIDDAHGTGVLGNSGRGSLELAGIEDKEIIVMGTLSKALGSQGGFVCGSRQLIRLLINKARSFIYTTGLNPASCGAALQSIDVIRTEPKRRQALLQKAEYLREQLHGLGYDTLHSATQIIPIIIGDVGATVKLSNKLMDNGIYCPAIRPPTVPKGRARLRISLMSGHTDEDVQKLIIGVRP